MDAQPGGVYPNQLRARGKQVVCVGLEAKSASRSGMVRYSVVYEDGMLRWSRGPEIGKQ
ncbi:hypothetical protein M5D96_006242 [Drosophila gunungcola]|uniref:Uncharacterized protein n=1 Tax=Drosophila gunungcola TaxID=103775 RepID=A0A9P9YNS4_9MUSC|nr:hypothetical protein M5D96_006242 [Drosophila gunungcola]